MAKKKKYWKIKFGLGAVVGVGAAAVGLTMWPAVAVGAVTVYALEKLDK